MKKKRKKAPSALARSRARIVELENEIQHLRRAAAARPLKLQRERNRLLRDLAAARSDAHKIRKNSAGMVSAARNLLIATHSPMPKLLAPEDDETEIL